MAENKGMLIVDMLESCSKCKFMYEFYGVKKRQLLNILENGGKAIISVETLTTKRKDCCPLVPYVTGWTDYSRNITDKNIFELSDIELTRYILDILWAYSDSKEYRVEDTLRLIGSNLMTVANTRALTNLKGEVKTYETD